VDGGADAQLIDNVLDAVVVFADAMARARAASLGTVPCSVTTPFFTSTSMLLPARTSSSTNSE
jgi:hypothetical protein